MKVKVTILLTFAILVFGFLLYSVPLPEPVIKPVTHAETPVAKSSSAPFVYSTQNPHLIALLSEYEAFINKAINNHQAPGAAVAIIKDSSIVFLKGFGMRDAATGDSVDVHTVFRIASVSKCFASTLTGVLVDEQRLTWNDHVVQYLPHFKLKSEDQTQNLTVDNVLSHTTGLPYHAFTDRVDQGANYDTLVYHLRDLDLMGRPGQLYSYQNVGYSLIGDVIRSATGKNYEENLKEKIFAPLHMTTASASYESIMANSDVAKPHRFYKKWIPMKVSTTYYNVAPAGGVNASIADMASWIRELTVDHPKILKPETRDEIFNPRVRAISRNNYFWHWKPVRSAHYALGWRVLKFRDDVLAYHGGYVNGYRSEVAILRKDKLAICVLVNAAGNLANISLPEFFIMYNKYRPAIDQWEKLKSGILARQ